MSKKQSRRIKKSASAPLQEVDVTGANPAFYQPPAMDGGASSQGYMAWFHKLRHSMRFFNDSKLFIGVLMITMNVAAKYVDFKFSKTQEQALRNGLAREIIIFAVAFMGTRDIVLSIILTGIFMLLAQVLFNEQSPYCIISDKLKRYATIVDLNKDGVVTLEEERRAIEVLDRADKQRASTVHGNIMSYLNANV